MLFGCFCSEYNINIIKTKKRKIYKSIFQTYMIFTTNVFHINAYIHDKTMQKYINDDTQNTMLVNIKQALS